MDYSFTGIAYFFLFCSVLYLISRFYKYWEKSRDTLSKLFLYFISIINLFFFLKMIVCLFFVNNPEILEKSIVAGALIQAFAMATIIYAIFYLKIPSLSPWIGFSFVLFLGTVSAFLTSLIDFNPYLSASGSIDWGIPSESLFFATSALRIFLFLITFLPLLIIFIQQFLKSEDAYVRTKTFGMIAALVFAFVISSLDFFLIGIFKLDPLWRDVNSVILSVILIISLLASELICRKNLKSSQ